MAVTRLSKIKGGQAGVPPWPADGLDARPPVLFLPAASHVGAKVREHLDRAGANLTVAADHPDFFHRLQSEPYALAIVDLSGGDQALSAIRLAREQFPTLFVAAVMQPSDPALSAEALQSGAVRVLPWPCEERDAMAVLAEARDRAAVDPAAPLSDPRAELVVYSPAMRSVADAVREACGRRTPVIVTGDAGTGRTLVARLIHALDNAQVTRPFIRVDCAAGAPDPERQLFGVIDAESPSETDSLESVSRASALVRAQGGTILLAHVEEAAARVQIRLARVLRDREVHAADVGERIHLDVRIVASAATDVDGAVTDGRLRRDLMERLAATRIDMPSLSRRREDIPVLAAIFLQLACEAERSPARHFSRAALTLLAALPWKGNARELRDLVSRVVLSTRHPVIQLEDVLAQVGLEAGIAAPPASGTLRQARAQFEREWISATLARHHGRVGEAAKALGIQRTNLYRKIRQLKVPSSLISGRK